MPQSHIKMLKFSIIIPIYNTAQFIGRCVDSCIKQSYSNIEIICVDDCSTDNSKDILSSFQNKDNRIKCIFHSRNESQYMARLNGFSQATGDYILFLDSDDTIRIDACDLIAKQINDDQPDIVQFGYREIPGGRKVFSPFYSTSKERILGYLARENRYSPEVWTKAYKRSVIASASGIMEGFFSSCSEDLYTSIVFTYFAKTYSFLKKPLVNYSTDTGWSKKKDYSLQTYAQWLSSYTAVIQKTHAFINQYIPEFSVNCPDMEFYSLKNFLYNRLPQDLSPELKCRFFEILPSYFSNNTIYSLFDEFLVKSYKYDKYFDFNVSFLSKTKKLLLLFLLYLKSFLVKNHADIQK